MNSVQLLGGLRRRSRLIGRTPHPAPADRHRPRALHPHRGLHRTDRGEAPLRVARIRRARALFLKLLFVGSGEGFAYTG
jgi:hypothetical protein